VGPAWQREKRREGALGLGKERRWAGLAHAGKRKGRRGCWASVWERKRGREGPWKKEERGGEESWARLASCWVGLPSFIPSPFLLFVFLTH
jgi:hypothetical protein